MMQTMFALPVGLALAYAGMAGLCLAMERHHKQVWAREPGPGLQPTLRAGGWLLLALAAWPCVAAWGASVGTVVWLGLLSAAALLLALLLPYAPRSSAWLALLAGVIAPAALAGLAAVG